MIHNSLFNKYIMISIRVLIFIFTCFIISIISSCSFSIYSISSLIDLLGSEYSNVREDAVVALGNKGPKAKESIPFLINALNDEDSDVRCAVVTSLAKIDPKGEKCLNFLINSLKDKGRSVPFYTIDALEKIALSTPTNSTKERTILKELEVIIKSNSDLYDTYDKGAARDAVRKIQIKILKTTTKFADNQTELLKPSIDNQPPQIIITSKGFSKKLVMTKMKKITVSGTVNDDSGVAEVLINNKEAALDGNGNFSADIFLKIGINQILIKAMDIYENKIVKNYSIERVPTQKVKISKNTIFNVQGKYYALIIGINNYKHLKQLETAVEDSIAVAKALEDYGFTITMLTQGATRNKIMKEMNRLRHNLNHRDKLLVYYAGHGFFNKNTEKAYWLPIDAEPNDTTNWIIADSITSSIKSIPAKHILIVSDSCYSGTLSRKVTVDLSANNSRFNYINKMLNKKARVLIASGGSEPVVDNNGSGHSVFAEAFITALNCIDKYVFTAEELFVNQLKEPVAGNAFQTPEYKMIRDSGHNGGDFVFIRKRN